MWHRMTFSWMTINVRTAPQEYKGANNYILVHIFIIFSVVLQLPTAVRRADCAASQPGATVCTTQTLCTPDSDYMSRL